MKKCPWIPCGMELGDEKEIAVHVDHERWAADEYHDIVVRDKPDGTRDVYVLPPGRGEELRISFWLEDHPGAITPAISKGLSTIEDPDKRRAAALELIRTLMSEDL
jgi:hypothetical protein